MKETKFYEFNQNNSGGTFDVDENVCHRVIIEAKDEKQALEIFKPMIENQSVSCDCCGDRWSTYSPDFIDIEKYKEKGWKVGVYSHHKEPEKMWFDLFGEFKRLEEPVWEIEYSFKKFSGKIIFETIEQYCQFMANEYGWTKPDIRIHYLNGTKKEIFTSNKK